MVGWSRQSGQPIGELIGELIGEETGLGHLEGPVQTLRKRLRETTRR